MAHQAIGLIETRGLVALVEGTDAMLKAANVELAGPMTQVGNALVTAVVVGDVAAVKAATDAGAQAIKAIKGDLVSVHVIARPHLDGLFGAHEMAKFGIIVDCGRQMLYVNPKGPSPASSQKLAQFLANRGFSRIPMHFNSDGHLEVDAALNGRPAKSP